MTQQVATNNCNKTCNSFNLDGVNMGSKTMNEIMAAAQMKHGWAENVMKADRAGVTNARWLNNTNTRQNVYGAVRLGLQTKFNFNSSDGTVKAKLGEWLSNLNMQFPAIVS